MLCSAGLDGMRLVAEAVPKSSLKTVHLKKLGSQRDSEHHPAEGKYTSPAAGAELMPLAWVLGCAGVVSPASRPVLT